MGEFIDLTGFAVQPQLLRYVVGDGGTPEIGRVVCGNGRCMLSELLYPIQAVDNDVTESVGADAPDNSPFYFTVVH